MTIPFHSHFLFMLLPETSWLPVTFWTGHFSGDIPSSSRVYPELHMNSMATFGRFGTVVPGPKLPSWRVAAELNRRTDRTVIGDDVMWILSIEGWCDYDWIHGYIALLYGVLLWLANVNVCVLYNNITGLHCCIFVCFDFCWIFKHPR